MKIQFQHLDTQSPKNDITLFGRTLEGKSVAVHVKGFRPSLCIKFTSDVDKLKYRINAALIRYNISRRIFKSDDTDIIKNISHEQGNEEYAFFEEMRGQDICDYNETHTPKFLKISTKNKWLLHDLKSVLTSKVKFVTSQKVNVEEDGLSTLKAMKKKRQPLSEVVIQSTKEPMYMLDKRYTVYNEQVDYGLQYLIERDIYSCSWMEVEGKSVEKPCTTCDIELVAKRETHRQIECNDVAPWRVLTYDIESVPHPRGNGKYDFPSAQMDPVCTIGAVLQIGGDIQQYVWIHSPNGDPIDKLSPVKDPTDEYTSEETKVFHFDSELNMLKSFNEFIVDRDIDIIEGYNSALFDHPYLFDRYHALNKEGYPTWGRFLGVESFIKEKVFQSNQAGKNVTKSLYCPGRIDHDGYQVMKKNHNLNSYKLDEVAKEFLGTKKYPMDYNEIHPKYQTKEGRDELASILCERCMVNTEDHA